jgi:hypothetical protein
MKESLRARSDRLLDAAIHKALRVPKCRKCGKWASQQDIDGDWWPPCGCGIEQLKYEDEA